MKTSFSRILPGLISTGAIVVGSLVVSGCTVSVGETATPPVDEPADGKTGTLTAYLVGEGSPPVPIEDLEIHASSEASDRLAASGCGAFVKPGKTGIQFRAGARAPEAFVEWASAQLDGKPAPARFAVAVAGEDDWKCAVEIDAPVLGALALRTREGAPARLSWDVRSEPKPIGPSELAAPEDGETAIGLLLPAVQKVREAAATDETTVALLLPAVQKVREAASRSQTTDYPLFPADVAPPPFEVDIDEETFGELFDGAVEGETEIGILSLHSSAADIITGAGPGGGPQAGTHAGGGGGGAGKVSMRDFHFVVPLKKEAIGSSRTQLKAIPIAGFRLMPPLTEARLAAASARVDVLKASAEPTLVLDEVSRVIGALKNQPTGSGTPQDRRNALLAYWRGDVAKGTAGAETSFETGLGSFLRRASDVEGLWAYSRLVTAAQIFEDTLPTEQISLNWTKIEHGRALSHAALRSVDEASLPMMPGRLRTTSDVVGRHDYRAAHGAVATMGEIAPLLEGGTPLAGIEPDEIDVALEARSGVKVAVGDVDGDGRGFLDALDQVLDAPTVTDAALADLDAKSKALATALEALRTATEARFAATK